MSETRPPDLIVALDELEAAAWRARDAIAAAVRQDGYRSTAERAELTLHMIQRWRLEGPPVAAQLQKARRQREAVD